MKIVEFATRRRVTILMVTVAIVLFGFVSLSRLKLNLLPDLSYPTLTVRTDLPGAAPLELETLVTRPIEESVGIIRNVRSVRSVSRAGQADVILEFAWGTDMDLAGIDVREKIDLLQLPLEASRPILLRFDPSTEPVMRYAFVDTDEFAKAIARRVRRRRAAEEPAPLRRRPAEAGPGVGRRLGGGQGQRRLRGRDPDLRGPAEARAAQPVHRHDRARVCARRTSTCRAAGSSRARSASSSAR